MSDAEKALDKAKEHLDEARALRPEVARVASSLRDLRERNHFAQTIAAVMRGDR